MLVDSSIETEEGPGEKWLEERRRTLAMRRDLDAGAHSCSPADPEADSPRQRPPCTDDAGRSVYGDPAEIITPNAEPLSMLLAILDRAAPAWHERAACRETNVDFTARSSRAVSEALQICGRCPVRADCLDWAIEIGDNVAVLGGMTANARRRLKRAAA